VADGKWLSMEVHNEEWRVHYVGYGTTGLWTHGTKEMGGKGKEFCTRNNEFD
jgi:hypothetical protein